MKRVVNLVLAFLLVTVVAPAHASTGITGKVTSDSGAALAGVLVTASQNGKAITSATTSTKGAYSLKVGAGSYSLSFKPRTAANSTLNALDIEAPHIGALNIMLTKPTPGRVFVTGNVSLDNGANIGGSAVSYQGSKALSDASGNFRLLPTAGASGPMVVEGNASSLRMEFTVAGKTSYLAAQDSYVDFEIPTSTQRVKVVTAAGNPVAKANVRLGLGYLEPGIGDMVPQEGLGEFTAKFLVETTTDSAGFATLPIIALKASTDATYAIDTVTTDGYVGGFFRAKVGAEVQTIILTQKVSNVGGSLKYSDGSPVTDTRVSLLNPAGGTGTNTDNQGKFNLGWMPGLAASWSINGGLPDRTAFNFALHGKSTEAIKVDQVRDFIIPTDLTTITAVDLAGKPIANAWVSARVGDKEGVRGALSLIPGQAPFQARSYAEGRTDSNGKVTLRTIRLDSEAATTYVVQPELSTGLSWKVYEQLGGRGVSKTFVLDTKLLRIGSKFTNTDGSDLSGVCLMWGDSNNTSSLTPNAPKESCALGKVPGSGGVFNINMGSNRDAQTSIAANFAGTKQRTATTDAHFNFTIPTYNTPVRIVDPQGRGIPDVKITINAGGGFVGGVARAQVIPDEGPSAGWFRSITLTDANGVANVPSIRFTNAFDAIMWLEPSSTSRYPSRTVYIKVGDNSQNVIVLSILKPTVVGATSRTVSGVKTATITGTNFLGAFGVKVGATTISTYKVVDDNTITFTVPALATGQVTITNGGGNSSEVITLR
jgi:hypothetical protein